VSTADIAVVGAGIVGLAVARELALRDPRRRVVVLEREDRVGTHQTGRNSGVVHAGIYYAPGSLKARLCVAGMRELAAYCEARGLAYERCGKLIVALDPGELPALEELERRGHANGVPGLRRVDAAGLREIEPHAAGIAALHSPETAIVDFAAIARAYADDVRDAGGEIVTGAAVEGIEVRAVAPADAGVGAADHAAAGSPAVADVGSGDSATVDSEPSAVADVGSGDSATIDSEPSAVADVGSGDSATIDSESSAVADVGSGDSATVDSESSAVARVGAADPRVVDRVAPGRRIVLRHSRGEVVAGFAVFCAGAWSDRLAMMAGAPADPRIVPFRGSYLRLVPNRRELVRGLIYPVPDPRLPFLGVHLTRHLGGDVLIGPTALLAPTSGRRLGATLRWPGSWRMARRWWRTGLTELHHAISPAALTRAAARYVPELQPGDAEPAWAGVRAQAVARDGRLVDDFAFSHTERALHVRNAPSPAATASLAIAKHVADEIERAL
jgi:L-2-hydroxyglutarate oxidase